MAAHKVMWKWRCEYGPSWGCYVVAESKEAARKAADEYMAERNTYRSRPLPEPKMDCEDTIVVAVEEVAHV